MATPPVNRIAAPNALTVPSDCTSTAASRRRCHSGMKIAACSPVAAMRSSPAVRRGIGEISAMPPRPINAGEAKPHVRPSATARSSAITVPMKPSTISIPCTDASRSVVTGAATPSSSNAASNPASSAIPPPTISARRTPMGRGLAGTRTRSVLGGRCGEVGGGAGVVSGGAGSLIALPRASAGTPRVPRTPADPRCPGHRPGTRRRPARSPGAPGTRHPDVDGQHPGTGTW